MNFEYLEPPGLDEAIELLADDAGDTVALAGGTSFALLLRQGLIRPSRVVGLRRIAELRGIRTSDDGLWIGALSTHREVEVSALVRSVHPELAAAFGLIATIRIRNQGTLGGNLAHADPAQDPPPILMAVDAAVHLAGPGGSRRRVPVDSFFEDFFTTVVRPGELVLGVMVPNARSGLRTIYHKFLPGSSDNYATVSVAVSIGVGTHGRVDTARIALAGVGPVPVRARDAESLLLGEVPGAGRLAEAADAARDAVDPLDDARGSAGYKREMVRVWVRRALGEAVA